MAEFYGVPTGWMDAVFALMLAGTVVVSMRVLGVTMIAAAVVIPPIIARLLTNSFGRMAVLSTLIGIACSVSGVYLSYFVNVSSGASVVLLSAALFVVALGWARVRSSLSRAPFEEGGLSRLPTGSVD